ncbi:MAG: DUF2208 family protein [Candidatus Brockarchaeota archaeon]|nr:DUF2208 family protein [Candidatus Brockarchaeota archaeon]
MKILTAEVLYEADVRNLKLADRGKRNLRSALIFVGEMAIIFPLVFLLGIIGIIIFFLAIFTFLPIPFVMTPSRYKIGSKGAVLDERRFFSFRKGLKLTVNEERKFVSLRHRWKGEVLRLYTPEPRKVYEIIENLIASIA